MADSVADTVVILSSELIARITEEYFNKTMFKQRVEIVDLKPTETGYMFSVAFVKQQQQKAVVTQGVLTQEESNSTMRELVKMNGERDSRGKFMKKVESLI